LKGGFLQMNSLFIVGTPIGNLQDITLRALQTLESVDLILTEDTRTTRKLLSAYGLKSRLLSYNEQNHQRRLPAIMKILESSNVALVSEAGMPRLSDPGTELVIEAIKGGVSISTIPGPSAITAAVPLASFQANEFTFLGFLPRIKSKRAHTLASIENQERPTVIFESPHRLRKTLQELVEILGNRQVTICREMTKLHEETYHGSLSDALETFISPRGEFTLIIDAVDFPAAAMTQAEALDEINRLSNLGFSPSKAVAQTVQNTDLSRRELYKKWLDKFRDPLDSHLPE